MYMGYNIEYSRKQERNSFGSLIIRKAVCSKEKLAEMIHSDKHIIWNANLCDIDEYLLNHPNADIEHIK